MCELRTDRGTLRLLFHVSTLFFNVMFLADLVTTNVTHVELSHPATESYMAFETHKCVAVAHAQYQLFALFPPTVPNHSIRFFFLCYILRTL